MNIEELRDFCLSLPGVTEATPFEKFSRGKYTILVFYVSGHMFCYFNIDYFKSVTIKCPPEQMADLKERYQAIGEPFNGNKRYWISVEMNSDVDDDHLQELVCQSYELVKTRKPQRKR